MDLLIGLGPLILLLLIVVWIVARGMRHDTHDRDTGGCDTGAGDGD